ncbi:MAG: hypothetical protein IPN33_00130 [Saprospiraceae bacterium]|nr:hypothetical protein [Saprospiraceae bacterium]
MYKLILQNQHLWGGRFNPIIPVVKNSISPEYIGMLKYFDPDYILYSKSIDLSPLYNIQNINPIAYIPFDENRDHQEIIGTNVYRLLDRYDSSAKVINSRDVWKVKSPLLSFYELNFNISTNAVMHEIELTKRFQIIEIGSTNFDLINKKIHLEKPINIRNLSYLNLDTTILRPRNHYNELFELIVANDSGTIEDLLYYWNRQLYENKNSFYITKEQLEIQKNDRYFGGILYDLSTNNTINVTSLTIDEPALTTIISEWLKPIAFNTHFQYKKNR